MKKIVITPSAVGGHMPAAGDWDIMFGYSSPRALQLVLGCAVHSNKADSTFFTAVSEKEK